MNMGWEEAVKQIIEMNVDAVDFSEQIENQILADVHHQLRKRRRIMKIRGKRTGIIIAAAVMALSAVTAFGAGKIAYLMSGHSINEELHDIDELEKQAKARLGETVKFPEAFSDGTAFASGIVIEVSAYDAEGNQVNSYPETKVFYTNGLNLSVSRPIQGVNHQENTALQSETYQDIQIYGKVDQYLFLPPDVEPSEEEKKLEEEGKLMISYGSSEVERESFTTVSWDEGELHYLISTFEAKDLGDMMELAKEVIDSMK